MENYKRIAILSLLLLSSCSQATYRLNLTDYKGLTGGRIFDKILGDDYLSAYLKPTIYSLTLCDCQVERNGMIEYSLVSPDSEDYCLTEVKNYHQFLLFQFYSNCSTEYILASNYQNKNLIENLNEDANCIGETILYHGTGDLESDKISLHFTTKYKYKGRKNWKWHTDNINLKMVGTQKIDTTTLHIVMDLSNNRISGSKGTGYNLKEILGFDLVMTKESN